MNLNVVTFGKKKGNRTPFSGVVTNVDKPSDGTPGGAWGKLLFPSDEMKKALPLLVGMPVNAEFDSEGIDWLWGSTGSSYLSGHNPDAIIGVFTEAEIKGNDVQVKGHMFSETYPQEVRIIQSLSKQGELGMSIEVDVDYMKEVEYEGETVLQAHGLTPLGAAILFKDRAAFSKTRLAAQKGVEKMEETIKEIKAAIEEMKENMVTKDDVKDFITAEALEGLAKTEEVVKVEDLEVKDVVKAEALEGFVKEDALKTFITAENLEESLKKITDRLVELEKKPVVEPQPIHAGTEEDVVTRLQKKMFA